MIKFDDICKFVTESNQPLLEVIPEYKVICKYYDNEEYFYTKDLSDINSISAPHIAIEFINEKEYSDYQKLKLELLNRSEYIWYLLIKEEYKHIEDKKFEEIYKKTWDEHHHKGGWDLVSEKMIDFLI